MVICDYTLEIWFPRWHSGKNPAVNTGDARSHGFDVSGLDRSSEYRKWLLTPVFLCGKSHGQRASDRLQPMGSQMVDRTKYTDTFYRYVLEHDISSHCTFSLNLLSIITDYKNQLVMFAIMTKCESLLPFQSQHSSSHIVFISREL